MKKVILALILAISAVNARDTMLFVDLDKVLDSADFKASLGDDVKFSFGSGSVDKIIANAKSRDKVKIGSENGQFARSLSGKTYNFTDIEIACGVALLENLIDLKKQAQRVGGTKVVNIISYYTKSELRDSKDSFLCYVGKRKVGVKLQADIAK